MKKIGIMSMQRVANYGSFLQGFALKNIVEDIYGEKVSFVDFHTTDNREKTQSIGFVVRIKTIIKFVVSWILSKIFGKKSYDDYVKSAIALFKFNRLFNKRFQKEFWPLLEIGDAKYDDGFDLLIIGSDEVFNFDSNEEAGYSRELIGIDNKTKKLISFSACCGYTTLESLEKSNATGIVRDGLKNFSALSARDMTTSNLIYELTGKMPEYHLDPVLCYDFKRYLPEIKYQRPYIAVYAHSGLSEEYKKCIQEFANKNKLDILCFMGYQGAFGTFVDANPFEVLSYIKNAEYIFTTTFHGCIFSIKYNKKFGVIIKESDTYSNNGKVGDLLHRLQLSSRIIKSPEKLNEVLTQEIDYSFSNEYIKNTSADGKEYLKNCIFDNYF